MTAPGHEQGKAFARLTALADEITLLRNRLREAIRAIEDLPDHSEWQKAELVMAIERHILSQIERLRSLLDAELHAIGDAILSSYEREDFLDHLEKRGEKVSGTF